MALALVFLGMARLQMGAVAEGLYREALRLFQAVRGRMFLSLPLLGMAGIAVELGESARAATLLGAIAALNDSLGITLVPVLRPWHDQLVERLHATADDHAIVQAWTRGQQLTPQQAIQYALNEA